MVRSRRTPQEIVAPAGDGSCIHRRGGAEMDPRTHSSHGIPQAPSEPVPARKRLKTSIRGGTGVIIVPKPTGVIIVPKPGNP